MGITLQGTNKSEEAMAAFKKALSIAPNFAEAINNMGNILKDQNKIEEATKAFEKALSIKPDFAEVHRHLSLIKKYTRDDKHFLDVKLLYKSMDLNDDSRCHLNFALSKMYEDIGEFDQAYVHLSEGNALRKKLLNYSIDQDENLFIKLKDVMPILFQNSLKLEDKSDKPKPIFILGMPRSGTTLVEQIITSHSNVAGGDELSYVSHYGFHLAVILSR